MKAHKPVDLVESSQGQRKNEKKNHQPIATITHWRRKLIALNVATVQCPGERQWVVLCYVDGLNIKPTQTLYTTRQTLLIPCNPWITIFKAHPRGLCLFMADAATASAHCSTLCYFPPASSEQFFAACVWNHCCVIW